MANCSPKELSNGFTVVNPTLLGAIVPNVSDKKYAVITVFNETDQSVKVSYRSNSNDEGDFIVPKGGRSFTRVINSGLMPASLKVQSLIAAATGTVIINLGN